MIRFASAGDVPKLVEMARRFHASSIYADKVQFSDRTLSASLTEFIAADPAIVMVIEKDGEVVGAIGGIIGPHFVAGGDAASELFWWVEPEHRGIGMALLTAYEFEIASRGARYSGMICPFGSGNVEKLYAQSGYAPMETIFYKEMA